MYSKVDQLIFNFRSTIQPTEYVSTAPHIIVLFIYNKNINYVFEVIY